MLVHPYDDRGMDVVGPNHALLADLYARFDAYLSDSDREWIRVFFAGGSGAS